MKSTAGFVLGLIGGIGSALLGIMGLFWGFAMSSIVTSIPGFGTLSLLRFVTPVIILIGGGLAIWGSILMHKDDNAKVKKGGILTLIGGIIGFNILSLIGGIIGLVQAGKTPQVQTTQTTQTV